MRLPALFLSETAAGRMNKGRAEFFRASALVSVVLYQICALSLFDRHLLISAQYYLGVT